MSGWLESCRRFVDAHALEAALLDIFPAFSSANDPCADERGQLESLGDLSLDLPAGLGEVDSEQAAMFTRRYAQVLALPGDASWTLLRFWLQRRMAGILASPPPRAHRVRALIDFAFGQAAVLTHGRPGLPQPWELAPTWRHVASGVEHGQIDALSALGPVHANLLRVRGRHLETLDARGMDLAQLDAVAVTSGGYFLYSEPDIEPPSRRGDPVGLLVHEGEVKNPPWLRRAALLQRRDGSVSIERVAAPGRRWTRADGRMGGEGPCWAVVGNEVVAQGEGPLPIPLAGAVIAGREPPSWQAADIVSAMAGGPMLLERGAPVLNLQAEEFAGSAPPITFSQDETHDQNLLPRLAVGLDGEGGLVFAAIDGRNFDRAPGFTLGMAARLLAAQGCKTAMNLDGGSSKRMLVQGEVADLPSTEVVAGRATGPVRPVHTAIVIR